jgi:hypothetical protein
MLLIPSILANIRSRKDKTFSISFDTNELTPENFTIIGQLNGKFGFLAFKEDEFKNKELDLLSELKSDYNDPTKSPSKRLRNVLFLNWKETPQGFKTAEEHYNYIMELIINHYKGKLS